MQAIQQQMNNVRPLFGHLPQELYREIYDFDGTYHDVLNQPNFLLDLKQLYYKRNFESMRLLCEEFLYYTINTDIHYNYLIQKLWNNDIHMNLIQDKAGDLYYRFSVFHSGVSVNGNKYVLLYDKEL